MAVMGDPEQRPGQGAEGGACSQPGDLEERPWPDEAAPFMKAG